MLSAVRKVRNQARRVREELKEVSARKRWQVKKAAQELGTMIERVTQVIQQTRTRIFEGNTKSPDKLVSVFEPHTEIIRKGKASNPTEFGKMVKIQEAENQIVTDYQVFEEKPADTALLVDAVAKHEEFLRRASELVAAAAGFYTQANEKNLEERGVKAHLDSEPAYPERGTQEASEAALVQKRQRWHTGCEGRISVLKRRHGLDRCLYRGQEGMKRWVGWGVIADTLIHIGGWILAKEKLRSAR